MKNTPSAQNTLPKFCVLPWHHIYVDPSGECKPCCLISTEKSWGNLNHSTLDKIWNNSYFTNFRKRILGGELPSDLCKTCIANENANTQSQRQRFLEELSFDFDKIQSTTSKDGIFPEIDLKLLDFRPSNLCNFKCRTCGPTYSSTWAKERKLKIPNTKLASPLKLSKDQIKNLEEVYFAGGEPLLMEEHYELLETLISMGKTKIRLRYNSNASVLGISNKSTIELWENFENIFFGCSIDETGDRAEYIRKGCSWRKIVENIHEIRSLSPHVRVTPNLTVSIFNILRLPEILEELLQVGILRADNPFDFTFNLVSSPEYFSPFILPLQYQQKGKGKIIGLFRKMEIKISHLFNLSL
jgi:radical SAM protein with 4Fe4S-binding SPASM domain